MVGTEPILQGLLIKNGIFPFGKNSGHVLASAAVIIGPNLEELNT
jgi:hypothetical protein